jgi:hypothetical protein
MMVHLERDQKAAKNMKQDIYKGRVEGVIVRVVVVVVVAAEKFGGLGPRRDGESLCRWQ